MTTSPFGLPLTIDSPGVDPDIFVDDDEEEGDE
jgi:hypothetical protein